MVDAAQVKKVIKILQTEVKPSQWETIRSVKQHDATEWAACPADLAKQMVKALQGQLVVKDGGNGKGRLPTLRQEVVALLGNMGTRAEAAIPQLTALLDDGESQGVREAAVTALGKIGPAAKGAVDKLMRLLVPGVRDTVIARVARALADIGKSDPKIHAKLSNLWLTPGLSESCREQLALALCKLDIDVAGLRHVLTKALLTNSHLSSRKVAAEGLSCCDPDSIGVVPAVVIALHDADEEVRALATAGLQRMKLTKEEAIERCGEQLEDCPHAEAALRRSGPLALPTLTAALYHKKPAVREKAAQILGSLGEAGAEAAKPLTQALRDKFAEVRLCAAKALWNITKKPDGVIPVLDGLLKEKRKTDDDDPESHRRFLQSVIEALGRIGPPALAAIPALKKQTKHENRLIRESAERTIRQISAAAVG